MKKTRSSISYLIVVSYCLLNACCVPAQSTETKNDKLEGLGVSVKSVHEIKSTEQDSSSNCEQFRYLELTIDGLANQKAFNFISTTSSNDCGDVSHVHSWNFVDSQQNMIHLKFQLANITEETTMYLCLIDDTKTGHHLGDSSMFIIK